MTHLATFGSELEAELLASQLKSSGIEYKLSQTPGNEECSIFVFDDDADEAQEILDSQAFNDDVI